MKLVCIKNLHAYHNITVGKLYEVIGKYGNDRYIIRNNDGHRMCIKIEQFESLEDSRENKLKQLGI
jgi:hypothetical protein